MDKHTKDTMTDLRAGQRQLRYTCASGVGITRTAQKQDYPLAVATLAAKLDAAPGVLLASSYEYPGRYRRWDIGFVNPPLMFEGRGRSLRVIALNQRGRVLLPEIEVALRGCDAVASLQASVQGMQVQIKASSEPFTEEQRSRQPTVFSALRALIAHFKSGEDNFLGLFGAFGYDLTFQFEDIDKHQQRKDSDRDLVLYLPDEILVADHRVSTATLYRYEFLCRSEAESENFKETTGGFIRSGPQNDYAPGEAVAQSDHAVGEFAATVRRAQAHFSRGELFEAVPGQVFSEPCRDKPSTVFTRLQKSNPAPYGALINLGESEYLVAASPEMFVRVRGRRVETCPISGTIARGRNAIEDAAQIKTLLNSAKDEAELSMCTDVDRNDKARVCEPGSIEVIGRRQIELYSRLIHTVDHVCGSLRDGMDALDAFLAHTWAVTVTGAPKLAAMQFIERVEKSPRHWYGGAMGQLGFDGNINTGLTLRTLRVKDGVGEVRAGATLLSDSVPEEEEAETRLKASALLAALRGENHGGATQAVSRSAATTERRPRALMVDHRDSFVHNLAHYFREAGVELKTLRPEAARAELEHATPDLLILSPGPGRPQDFQISETLRCAQERGVPVFGVCLGLQAMIEYFGGSLRQLPAPMHGKSSLIEHEAAAMFDGVPNPFRAGRYHSLVAQQVPSCLRVTARSDDGEVMAVEHVALPFSAVQFHPESILSLEGEAGRQLIANVVARLIIRQ